MIKNSTAHFLCSFISIVVFLGSCHTSKVTNSTYLDYEDKETGWYTRFPSSWEIVPDNEAASTESKGQKKIENTINRDIEMKHTRLLWIRNGKMNSFTSNKMVFDFKTAEEYNANMLKINDILIKTQLKQGLKLDYKNGSIFIDDLEFKTFEITIYSGSTDRILGNQLICSRYVNGRIGLLLNINYTNDKDKKVLMDILASSKLTIRN